MQFSLTFFVAGLASAAAVVQQRTEPDCATVTPYLAPGCVITGVVTNIVCPFPLMSLKAGECQDVTTDCPIHPPTSFFAQLNRPTASTCRVSVYPNFGCTGNPVDSGTLLGTKQTMCIEAPYFGKALDGGVLSSTIFPFGFKSLKLICT
ncbi:hypothetical protein LZ31DRAFT_540587 [Colletotrichum somersetense]|nr:hypothetical protein LZ31DRAFT_540587 [Colletotrichum somersetense]